MVWSLFPFKGHFNFGKSQKSQGAKSGCRGAESPGWFDVSPKISAGDVMHEWARCWDEAAHHQLPIAVAFWGLLNHPDSFCRGIFKLHAKFDMVLLLYTLIHFECDGHTVHRLTSWHLLPPLTSALKSSLFTHAHSSPLSLAIRLHRCWVNHSHHINNGWTFPRQTSYILTKFVLSLCEYHSGKRFFFVAK